MSKNEDSLVVFSLLCPFSRGPPLGEIRPKGRSVAETLRRFCHGRIRCITYTHKPLGGKASHCITYTFL